MGSGSVPGDYHHRLTALERQRRELLEVNKKWDEQYQIMKRFYEVKIQELRKRLASCYACAPDEEERETKHVHLEEKLVQAEQTTETLLERNSEVCAELLETERQTQRLRLQVTTLTNRGQQQQAEIRRLNKVLSETLAMREQEVQEKEARTQQEVQETEARTQVEVLTHQVRLYEEDFRKERADRKRLFERNMGLERKLETLHAQLQLVSSQVTRASVCTPKLRSHAHCGCHHRGRQSPPPPPTTTTTQSPKPSRPRPLNSAAWGECRFRHLARLPAKCITL
ncbi:hypothetical protein SKAU_G00077390 [Synaphobranchus kaupii]|uniref:TNFAIP3 interacting protein 3 n=1 Tax=Synaphobranchus kaupii TaxID=118154 RepID=A0A9Q1JA45_SYNKA|nr:hypothetical protein SKAU_G00077390 [Synaphobranchus kaupii]